MSKKITFFICLLLMLLQTAAFAAHRIDMGEPFPEIALPQPLSMEARSYLGLVPGKTFTLSQVSGEIVLVEILNVLCPHCQKQTLPYGKLFSLIQNDPKTRGRIKMLGIAVGNNAEQIEDFVDIYAVDFPIVSDLSFKMHAAVGGGPTPFSIYVRKDSGKQGYVAGSHLGEDKEIADLFSYLKETLALPVTEFSSLPIDNEGGETTVEAFLPPDLMAARIRKSFSAFGALSEFKELTLPSKRRVYRGIVAGRPLFAEVLARSAICDVCHNVHFYYLFDVQGKVIAFEPLHLTRYGNIEWNSEERSKMRQLLIGGSLKKHWNFDPQVDAISRATMTSAIIFNSLDQGRALLKELEATGYLKVSTK
ncbi:TlpA family protein disulfide reductase [Geopsychrobacter electrodiphilus]|uniref:TlpA family protein disulfide reductase n=1 Tax=Geopsychrobacter electrodiphilus TaxID=225196 RepID=UPI00035CB710|nr:redoxin domain-containing protein [Geopsychrobacter electrodiphilus]